MSTVPQILANQSNAQHSTGPVTPEGKARVARNATKLGLFSAAGFIRPGEEEIFNQFAAAYQEDLVPETVLEHTLATEIIRAAWRLRRCAELESAVPDDAEVDLERLQTSIDRARAAAQRALHRSLAGLRRIQIERVYRRIALPAGFDRETLGQTSCRDLDPAAILVKQVAAEDAQLRQALFASHEPAKLISAKQTQFAATAPVAVARNAPCPCGSRSSTGQALSPQMRLPLNVCGQRCCGRNAHPGLTAA